MASATHWTTNNQDFPAGKILFGIGLAQNLSERALHLAKSP